MKEKLIISRNEYMSLLFAYRNNNPKDNIKIIDTKTFVDMISFSYKKDPTSYLLKKDISYLNSQKLLHYLKIADYKKSEELNKLYQELLDNNYIEYDYYNRLYFDNKDIYFFELSNDDELVKLANRNKLEYSFLKIEELKLQSKEITDNKIYYFNNKYEQYTYIFQDIKKKILSNELDKNKITILIDTEDDFYYLDLMSKLYKIDVMLVSKKKLITNPEIRHVLNQITEGRSFDDKIIEQNEDIKEIVNKYELNSLDFDKAYLNLTEILSSLSYKTQLSNKGLKVTTSYNFDLNTTYYVTNFKYGSFSKVFDDSDLYSDSVKKIISLNPSYLNTHYDFEFKTNFVKYLNISMLSMCKRHFDEKNHDTNLIDSKILKELIIFKGIDEKSLFTTQTKPLFLSDMESIYKIDLNVDKYDNSYTRVNFAKDKRDFSVTNIEQYAKCPFKYYLDLRGYKVPNDNYYRRFLGTFIHSIYEDIYDNNFDFNDSFDHGVEEILKKNFKRFNVEYSPKFAMFTELVRYWLEFIIKRTGPKLKIGPEMKFESEKDHVIEHKTKKGHEVKIKCQIDKVVYDNNYYTIVDYKTGNEKFEYEELIWGNSVQLPVYYLAASKEFMGRKFGGFYISKAFFRSLSKLKAPKTVNHVKFDCVTNNSIDNFLKWKGIAYRDALYLDSMTDLILDKKNQMKETELIDINPSFNDSKLIKGASNSKLSKMCYSFDDLLADTNEGLDYVIDNVIDNNFPIKSKKINNDISTCKYCSFKAICYRRSNNYVDFKELVEKHFAKFLKEGK